MASAYSAAAAEPSALPTPSQASASALRSLDSRKLYYGFPVYILAYRDPLAKSGWSMTTGSSSYSLSRTAAFGVTASTHAATCIERAGECTLSLVSRELMPVAERLGSTDGAAMHDKIERSGAGVAELENGMRYLSGSPIVLDLEIRSHDEFEGYVNFLARVRGRSIAPELLDERGNLRAEGFAPVNLVGDIAKNIYRFPSGETRQLGDFLR